MHFLEFDQMSLKLFARVLSINSVMAWHRTDPSHWRHMAWLGQNDQSKNLNTLRPRQNGRHFPDDIFKCISLNENVWISLKMSLKFGPKGPINNIPALVQIMALRRPGDKPLSEPMIVSLLTHICVTRPQWVNENITAKNAFFITEPHMGH